MLMLVACGDDSAPPPADTGGPRDAGPDMGGPDAPPVDAPTMVDAGDSGMTMGECGTTPADVFMLTEGMRIRPQRVALAPAASGVVAMYAAAPDGFEDVFARTVPSTGDVGTEHAITDHFATAQTPALVAVSGGYLSAWFDNDGTMGFQVVTRLLGADGAPSGGAQRITMGDGIIHDAPYLAAGPSGVVAAFVEDDIMGSRTGQTMLLNASGAGAAAATTIAATSLQEMRLVPLPMGVGALFVRPMADEQHVFFQPLDADGRVAGALERIDNGGNAIGTVDGATGFGGDVGVAFDVDVAGGGVRTEVHFRRVDGETGAAVGLEGILTGSGRGRDPGIAALAGGFAVAYRALDGEGEGYPKIRLAFVSTSTGDVTDEIDLDSTSETGGPVAVEVGLDGTLVIGWAHDSDDGSDIMVRRVRCGG